MKKKRKKKKKKPGGGGGGGGRGGQSSAGGGGGGAGGAKKKGGGKKKQYCHSFNRCRDGGKGGPGPCVAAAPGSACPNNRTHDCEFMDAVKCGGGHKAKDCPHKPTWAKF